MIEKQHNQKIKFFQSDHVREYMALENYFKSCGIRYRVAYAYTHEQNGAFERKIRHIVDNLSLLAHSRVSFDFLHYAFSNSI